MSSYGPTYPPGTGQRAGTSRSGQPPSFKTNVNRNKTKRWVNAKSESYDGDDWGSSDDEESDEDTPDVPPVPGSHSAHQPGHAPARHPHQAVGAAANTSAPSQSAQKGSPVQGAPATGPDGQDKHTGAHPQPQIVRPADIYKRMAQERGQQPQPQQQQQQQQQPSSQSTQPEDPTPAKPEQREQSPRAQLPELGNFSSSFGDDLMGAQGGHEPAARRPPAEPEKPSDAQTSEGELQHNPSLGFRSVVNQAFDTPDTPDTLARSGSESTTQISPIIRSGTGTQETRPAMTDAPPTIEEEPTDRRDSVPQDFRPGFRRSLTPPNSDHTPSHRPVVSERSQPPAQSEMAQVAEDSAPAPKSDAPSPTINRDQPRPELTVVTKPDGTSSARTSRPASRAATDGDPAGGDTQLQGKTGAHSAELASDPQSQEAPPVPPPKSEANPDPNYNASPARDPQQVARGVSGEHLDSPTNSDALSPDSVNDRLREAIMQSLSPSAPESASDTAGPHKYDGPSAPTQDPGSSSHQQSKQTSSEYDRYWSDRPSDGSAGPPPLSTRGPPVAEDNTTRTQVAEREDSQPSRPQLKKKFSWEADSSDEGDSSQPLSQNQHRGNQQSKAKELTAAERDVSPAVSIPSVGGSPSDSEPDELQDIGDSKGDPPRYSTIQPRKANTEVRHVAPADVDNNNVQSHEPERTVEASEPLASDAPILDDTQVTESQPSSPHKRIPGFREILSMEAHDKKLATFIEARDQFATTDTGLDAWIQHIAESLPEHDDVVTLNGQVPSDANLHHKAMNRPKFPKLSSFGTLSIPSTHHDSSHTRQPSNSGSNSMAHSQQVQARGKDLLHSAGVLGGKAGGAAKGLLAKGRNRLRNTGSGDKDPSQTPTPRDSDNQSHHRDGIDPAQQSRAVTPRSHVDRYERPLPPLPSSPPAVVAPSDHSHHVTTKPAATTPTGLVASGVGNATPSYPVSVPSQASITPGQNSTEDQQVEPRGFASETAADRAFADANRRSSPVSTLGTAADTSWFAGGNDYGNGGYSWKTGSRRESVSTLGMSGGAPSLDLPRSPRDGHAAGDETPTPQVTLENTIMYKQRGHTSPERGVENLPTSDQRWPPETGAKLGADAVSTPIPHESTTSNAKENDSSGHGGPPSGEAEASGGVPSSTIVAMPAPPSDGENRHVVPPKLPPTVMDGSEYQRILAKSLGMPVSSPNTTGSPVNNEQKRGVPALQSSNHALSSGVFSGLAWKTVDDTRTSAVLSSDGRRVAHGSSLTQHTSPTAQLYPSSDQQTKPTNARPAASHQPARNPSPDLPPQPRVSHQSRAAFSGFVSKLQSGLQKESKSAESSPIAGKERNSRLRTAMSDVRKRSSLAIQPTAKQSDGSLVHPGQTRQLGRETPPIEDSKKTAIHKALGRRSQTEPPADDDQRKPHHRVTALLRKHSSRGSPERRDESTPIAEYYAPQLRPVRYSDNLHQFQGGSNASGPQVLSASRPGRGRYYQPDGETDNGLGGTYSQRHSSPFIGQGHYNGAVQSQRQSPTPLTKPLPPPIDTNVHPPGKPYNDNTRASQPPQQEGQGNPRAYTTRRHIRPGSSPQKSPVHTRSESANNNDDGSAYDPGIFHTADPWTRRARDQKAATGNNGQQRGKNKHLSSNMSPHSISEYPLPESNVISPVNPAASDLPPPPPPKYPIQQPNTSSVTTAPTDQPALTTSKLPSERPRQPTNTEADNGPAEPFPASQSNPAAQNRKRYTAPETISGDAGSSRTPTTAVPDDMSVKGMGPHPVPSESAEIAELPAKVTGDESSEEIVMSSTAYPGQEWYPDYVEDSD